MSNKLNLQKLREEAKKLMKKDISNLALRSCWNCNGAHEHLKDVDYVIRCFQCGRIYFKGQDITDNQTI